MNNPILEELFFCKEGIVCEKHLVLSQEVAEKYKLPRRIIKEQFKKAGGVIKYD